MESFFIQFVAIALIVLLISAWALIRLSRKKTTPSLSIQKRPVLLDSQLREFKKKLADSVTDEFHVYPRVRLTDLLICKFKSKDKASLSVEQQLTSMSIDFVLVDKLSGQISCLIQMDQDEEKTAPFKLLESTCQQAKLPLVHFSKENTLDSITLRKQIWSVLEPTINLEDDGDSDEIKIYLEPVSKKSENEHNVVLDTM